jgi:ABC-2 type transport system ATP-binding protein
MRKLGKKELVLHLNEPLRVMPPGLERYRLETRNGGNELVYTYDTHGEHTGITALLSDLRGAGLHFNDLKTKQSSLEEIFVSLVGERK